MNIAIACHDHEALLQIRDLLLTQDQKALTIPIASIEFRSDPKSVMPAMGQVLSLEEMRDIIEFLAGLKK